MFPKSSYQALRLDGGNLFVIDASMVATTDQQRMTTDELVHTAKASAQGEGTASFVFDAGIRFLALSNDWAEFFGCSRK